MIIYQKHQKKLLSFSPLFTDEELKNYETDPFFEIHLKMTFWDDKA